MIWRNLLLRCCKSNCPLNTLQSNEFVPIEMHFIFCFCWLILAYTVFFLKGYSYCLSPLPLSSPSLSFFSLLYPLSSVSFLSSLAYSDLRTLSSFCRNANEQNIRVQTLNNIACAFAPSIFNSEQQICSNILSLLQKPPWWVRHLTSDDLIASIPQFEDRFQIALSQSQTEV